MKINIHELFMELPLSLSEWAGSDFSFLYLVDLTFTDNHDRSAKYSTFHVVFPATSGSRRSILGSMCVGGWWR